MVSTKATVENQVQAVEAAAPPVRRSIFREYFESIVVTVILALFGTTFAIQAFKIPSSSMEDTLLIGDHLMVDKEAYAPHGNWLSRLLPYETIQRGDIIVFRYPVDPSTHFVKRVVGLPGDRIRVVHKDLYRNGHLLSEGYVVHKIPNLDEYRDNFPSSVPASVYAPWAEALPNYEKDGWLVVPPGHYFAMGDNRDFSSDGRYWGFVPRDNIVGKPVLIYWSLESTSSDYRYSSTSDRLAGILKTIVEFPFKTRWGRMFLLIRPEHQAH
jgi:signal peptidase I